MTWLQYENTNECIVGISAGTETANFTASDFSSADACEDWHPQPVATFNATGKPGGPFNLPSKDFLLTNTSADPVSYTLMTDRDWLMVQPGNGSIAAAGQTSFTVSINDAATSQLAAGEYTGTIVLNDETNNRSTTMQAVLTIVPLALPVTNPNPANGATGVDINANLSWSGGAGADALDLYFGTTNPPPFRESLYYTATSFSPGYKAYNTTYYWKVVPRNGGGETPSPVWTFTTKPSPSLGVSPTSITLHCEAGETTRSSFVVTNTAAAGSSILTGTVTLDLQSTGRRVTDQLNLGGTSGIITKYAGNCYYVTTSTVLTQFAQPIYSLVPTAMTIDFMVLESLTPQGTYTRVYSQPIYRGANSYDYVRAINLSVPLRAGRYYIVAIGWANPDISLNLTSYPSDSRFTSFGRAVGRFDSNVFPLGSSIEYGSMPGAYQQYLTSDSSRFISLPDSISANAGGLTYCSLVGNATDLQPGTYDGEFLITSNADVNSTQTVAVRMIVSDTKSPAMSVPDMANSSDTGRTNTDNVTAEQLPLFTGVIDEPGTVTVYLDGESVAALPGSITGWEYTPSDPLPDGEHTLAITAIDALNNASALSPVLFVIDTSPPVSAPPMLDPFSDTGISSIDGITQNAQPLFSGVTDPFASVELFLAGNPLTNGIADQQGQWQLYVLGLPQQVQLQVKARSTDLAGNVGELSAASLVTIDRTRPEATITGVPLVTEEPVESVNISFDEPVYGLTANAISLAVPGDTTYTPIPNAVLTGGPAAYVLSNLSTLTSQDGNYNLSFAASPISDAAGNIALAQLGVQWTKSTPVDLRVESTLASDSPTTVGQPITFEITVHNDGAIEAAGVVLDDVISTNCIFASADGVADISGAGQHVVTQLGSIAPGASKTVSLTFSAIEIGPAINVATVTGTKPDPVPANNTATENVEVMLGDGPDLFGDANIVSVKCKGNPGSPCSAAMQLLVQNRGNRNSGKSVVQFYLSQDANLDAGDVLLKKKKKLPPIAAGHAVAKLVKLRTNSPLAGHYLIAVIPPGGTSPEASLYNNQMVCGPIQ